MGVGCKGGLGGWCEGGVLPDRGAVVVWYGVLVVRVGVVAWKARGGLVVKVGVLSRRVRLVERGGLALEEGKKCGRVNRA